MRLQKFLAKSGLCSRRAGEEYIKAGRVTVNDVVITRLGTQVHAKKDCVKMDGRTIKLQDSLIYIAVNKPAGYISSCRHRDAKVVVDLVDVPQRVYPVGRLDKDSTGLVLLTNDGKLHLKLSHPSFDHEKEYEVTVVEPLSDGALQKMEKGLILMGKKTRPAKISKLSSKRFRITLKEGRNRQIRRMVRKVGGRVAALKRIRMASLTMGSLKPGQWRYLNENEITKLKA
jgi:pseudouridine synthase